MRDRIRCEVRTPRPTGAIAIVVLLLYLSHARAEHGFVLSNGLPAQDAKYEQRFRNLRAALLLLRNDYRVLWISKKSEIQIGDKRLAVGPGDFLVHGRRKDLLARTESYLARLLRRKPIPVESDSAIVGYPLSSPRILVDAQPWSGNYNWYFDTLTLGGFSFTHMFDHRRRAPDVRYFNVLIAPGGGGNIPPKYNELLKSFVTNGGNYVGSCWGAAQAIYPSRVGYGTGNGASIADAYNHEVVRSFGALGGVGVVKLRNQMPSHPVMWGLPRELTNIYWNGPVMRVGPNARVLATLSAIDKTSFQFHARGKTKRQQDVDEEHGKALYVVSHRPGEGKVILFGNHPEASTSINPFPAFEMGHHATFNAILFAVAGRETDWKDARTRPAVNSKRTVPNPRNRTEQVKDLSKQVLLASQFAKKVASGSNLDEDQPAGCYLIRVARSLQQIHQRFRRLEQLMTRVSPALNRRARHWQVVTDKTCRLVRKHLKATKPRRMNRWNSWWQPIVGPSFERAQELEQLIADCELYLATRTTEE